MTKLSDKVLNAMVEDSYEAWKSIIQNYPNVTDLLCYLETCNHVEWRVREIRRGLEHNLTYEQIKMYARPEFDYTQMRQIRFGLESGLTNEEIEIYARPEFSAGQMMEMYYGYRDGLTVEHVSKYANPKLSEHEMCSLRMDITLDFLNKDDSKCKRDIQLRKDLLREGKIIELKKLMESKA